MLISTGGCARILAGPNAHKAAEQQFQEGLASEQNGDFGEAEDCYEDALDYDANHEEALIHLGRMYSRSGRHGDAYEQLQRAVLVTGGSVEAYNELGQAYEAGGRPDRAEEAYRQGIKADPDDKEIRKNFGMMLAKLGRTKESLRQLRAAMSEQDARDSVALIAKANRKRSTAKGG